MRRVAAAIAAGAVLGLGLGAVPAASAQTAPELTIRDVDATDSNDVSVTFAYSGDRADLSDLVVRENGQEVESSEAVPIEDQQQLGVVLVIDASKSMEEGALIERVKEAAHEFVAAKHPSDQIAVVSFNNEVRTEQDFTTSKDELDTAIDKIALANDTKLYDGIVQSAELFKEQPDLQPNLVVFSDGGDNASVADANRAQASVEAVGGALFAIGVENSAFHVLEDMAAATGGASAIAANPSDVSDLFSAVETRLHKQYITSFQSTVQEGTVPLTLTVGQSSASVEYIAGSQQAGAAALRPQAVEEPSGPSFLHGGLGLFLGLLLVAGAIGVVAYLLGQSFFGGDMSLRQALRPYSEGYVAAGEEDDHDDVDQGLAQTPLLQRAVEATGQFAERQGFLTKVEGNLERANLPLRPAEALFFYMAGVLAVIVLTVLLTQSGFATLFLGLIVVLVPPGVVKFLAGRRQKQFNSLLPDTLQLLASTLRAGYSLMQGVEAVSQEVSEPVGRELRRVVTEARLGRPLEESLDAVAERMDSADFGWAVMAIRIQREVGGNLAELLVTVAETMTERERLRRDVNALTAEGKISAIVLGILPIGLMAFIKLSNPSYLDPLFEETIGKILLGGAVGLMLFGFWWMWKTIQIDI